MKEQGGLLSAEDLANYHSPVGPPERRRFGDLEVFTCGAWCQGPVLLQTLALLEGDRPRRARPQQRRLCPPFGRGAEARLCRSRGLLRRPGDGRGAARDPDLRGIRGRAPQADPPRPGLAGNAAARRARQPGAAAALAISRGLRASPTPSPTPPMSASPTVSAICSRRPRATAPMARRWCRAPG